MRRLILLFGFICLYLFGSAQDIPEPMQPPRLVNDFAKLLSEREQEQLEHKLYNYYDTTSTQIYIVTVRDLKGYDIADYAVRLGNLWGVGQKDKNNGVVILVKPKVGYERGEIYIATGYGMEGVLPDAYVKRIIDRQVITEFKTGNYYYGLNKAVTSIILAAQGEYKRDPEYDSAMGSIIVFLIYAISILIFIVSAVISSAPMPKTPSANRTNHTYYNSNNNSSNPTPTPTSTTRSSSSNSTFKGGGGGKFGGGGAGGSW